MWGAGMTTLSTLKQCNGKTMKIRVPENCECPEHLTRGKVYEYEPFLGLNTNFGNIRDDDGDTRTVYLPGSYHLSRLGNIAWEIVEE